MFLPDPKPALYHAPAEVYGCGIGIIHSLLSLVVLLPSLCLCVCVEWEINYNTISTSLSCIPTESASDCCREPDSDASVGEGEPQPLSMMLIWAEHSLLPL